MKPAVGLTLAALALLAPAMAAPGGELDVGQRAEDVSTEEKALLPEKKIPERNEIVQDRRFDAEEVPKETAPLAERRAPFDVREAKEKKLFITPDRPAFEVIPREEHRWADKKAPFSTADDAYRSRVAIRFQDKIGEASPIVSKPLVSKRTSFDKINRFVFRKNADQRVIATPAGDGGQTLDISTSSSAAGGTDIPSTR
jgi:hypothetical protein